MDVQDLLRSLQSGLPGTRACLLMSREGLLLEAHPTSEEKRAYAVWRRLVDLGDVKQGFAVVGDELWAFCRQGAYSALVIADVTVRPGLALEELDHMLLAAEAAIREDKGPQDRAEGAEPFTLDLTSERVPATRLLSADHLGSDLVTPSPQSGAHERGTKTPDDRLADATDDSSDIDVDTAALAREFAGLLPEEDLE